MKNSTKRKQAQDGGEPGVQEGGVTLRRRLNAARWVMATLIAMAMPNRRGKALVHIREGRMGGRPHLRRNPQRENLPYLAYCSETEQFVPICVGH